MSFNDEITDPQAPKQVVETAEKVVAPATTETVTQPGGVEKSTTETTAQPFHKDPEVQKYLDRQLSKREAAWNKQVQELKDGYTRQLEMFNSQRVAQGKPEVAQLPPEQEQALKQLVDMLGPRLREQLGLGKLDTLEKQLSSMSAEGSQSAFESELGSVVTDYATKHGYEKTELEEDLREFMANDEWFADKPYSKGAVQKAAKLYFADKGQELADRAARLNLIKEQNAKKAQSTESPAKGKGAPAASKGKSLQDFLDKRVSEAGGIEFD